MNAPRTVLVLGATGFVGRNVTDLLRAAGHKVLGLSRSTGCDLLDLPEATRAIQAHRPDFMVNCAAFVGSVNFVSDFAGSSCGRAATPTSTASARPTSPRPTGPGPTAPAPPTRPTPSMPW